MAEQPPATFPNFIGKHDHDALFSPDQVIGGHPRLAERDWTLPENIVLFYQGSLARYLEQRPETTKTVLPITYPGPKLFTFDETDGAVGAVGGFGVGSPAAAMVLEVLIALGCKRVINIGACGGLQPDMPVGAVAVGASAIRDEGTSHHYMASVLPAEASTVLTALLTAELDERAIPYRVGRTWTIDAVYRETLAETRHYRDLGVLTVEMEAAAVYAVASFRGIEAAGAFVVADILHEDGWKMDGLWAADAHEMIQKLLEACISTLG